jgi:hypothetical protein
VHMQPGQHPASTHLDGCSVGPTWTSCRPRVAPAWRRRSALSLTVALVALIGTVAESAAAEAATQPSTPAVVALPASELGPILSTVPVRDLGLDETQLGELLAKLNPELSSKVAELAGAVGGLLGSNSSATLGELTEGIDKQSGPLGGLLKELLPSLDPGEVVERLSPTQLEKLLENLAGGEPLGSLTTAQLTTLLERLAGKLSGEPAEALTRILNALKEGASLDPSTVGTLAEHAGVAPETLANDVGTSAKELPTSEPALEGAVGSEGPVVGVVKDADGLAAALLPREKPSGGDKGGEGAGGKGESAGGKGDESTGGKGGGGPGSGGQGGSGGPSSTGLTAVVMMPSTPISSTKASVHKLAGVRVIRRRVKHGVATLVVQVPAAGLLTLSGPGVSSVVRTPRGAGRVTLTVRLDRAGAASLRSHHDRLRVPLRVLFAPSGGQRSSARATVTFG